MPNKREDFLALKGQIPDDKQSIQVDYCFAHSFLCKVVNLLKTLDSPTLLRCGISTHAGYLFPFLFLLSHEYLLWETNVNTEMKTKCMLNLQNQRHTH